MGLKPKDGRVLISMQLILDCHWLVCVRGEGLNDRSNCYFIKKSDLRDKKSKLPFLFFMFYSVAETSKWHREWDNQHFLQFANFCAESKNPLEPFFIVDLQLLGFILDYRGHLRRGRLRMTFSGGRLLLSHVSCFPPNICACTCLIRLLSALSAGE